MIRTIIACAFACTLMACGGGDDGPVTDTGPADPFPRVHDVHTPETPKREESI